jgi:hypothetical protein
MTEEINKTDSFRRSDMAITDMPESVQSFLRDELSDWSNKPLTLGQPGLIEFEGINTYTLPIHDDPNNEGGFGEEIVLIVDTSDKGDKIGLGILAIGTGNAGDKYKKPYVGETHTDDDHTRQGLGIRRLKLMNRLALELFGLPLNSDPIGNTTGEAVAVWQKLVQADQAELYVEDGIPRFRFKA